MPVRSRCLAPLALALVASCGPGPADTSDVVLSAGESESSSASATGSTGSSGSSGEASSSASSGASASGEASSQGSTSDASSTSAGTTGGGDCTPGAVEGCYGGPAETAGVGACKAGQRSCDGFGFWGPCLGEVVPVGELCGNTVDDDCDGDTDEDVDADGDGFSACAGDCCDAVSLACQQPALVNPGAYEVPGNEVDDDCDGDIDEATPLCDDGIVSNAQNPLDYARAIDLCQTTVENPPDPADRTWGVISAKFTLADGKGAPKADQRAIRPGFGGAIAAKSGKRLAILSSGNAAAVGDTSPAYAGFQSGVDHMTQSAPPADWSQANGGVLPNPPGCQAPAMLTSNDPIMLTLRVRAPTNAKSFKVKMFFFSAEYPEWVCSQYNDFFVALLDSKAAGNPIDKNIAVFDDGKQLWPVGVNLVKVAAGLFTACENGVVGCVDKMIPESNYAGCKVPGLLKGTGFDEIDPSGCGTGKPVGGGTGWLTMSGNVEPGEVFELRLAIWDSGGHIFDSLVLLDDWKWSLEAAEPGIVPG